jgi:hypothetical protein
VQKAPLVEGAAEVGTFLVALQNDLSQVVFVVQGMGRLEIVHLHLLVCVALTLPAPGVYAVILFVTAATFVP